MNLFQIITLPLVTIMFFRSVIKLLRGRKTRGVLILGAAIWLAAAVLIFDPNLTMKISKIFGIGRGADLILYLLILTLLIVGFCFYDRIRKIESNISKIVRQLALRDALEHWPQSDFEITKEDKESGRKSPPENLEIDR